MARVFLCTLTAAMLSPFCAHGAHTLTPASIRAFIAGQNRAWNGRDFARFYATFAPRAQIVLIRTTADGKVTRTVRSLAEDRRKAERFFATTRAIIRETGVVKAIQIAPDGRHARVQVLEDTGIVENGKPRQLRAIVEEELEMRDGRVLVRALTERQ